MGLMERFSFWRRGDAMLQSRAGARFAEATGGVVNRLAAVMMTSRQSGDVPWSPLTKPLSECRLAVVTTAGLHLAGDRPFDVDSAQGDPSFRSFPSESDHADLRIAHTHFSRRYYDADPNVILPLDGLRKLADSDVLHLAPRFFSFGYAGTLTRELVDPERGTAPRLAAELHDDGVDLALLVPA